MSMNTMETQSGDSQGLNRAATGRREYVSPRLELLGRMSDLTASGSKSGKENHGNVAGNRP
jgi:hypothetical protein